MPLTFRCPSCVKISDVVLERTGKRSREVRCSKCTLAFPLPDGNAVELADPGLPVRIAECAMVHQVDRSTALTLIMEIWSVDAAKSRLAPAVKEEPQRKVSPLLVMGGLTLAALIVHAAGALSIRMSSPAMPEIPSAVRAPSPPAESAAAGPAQASYANRDHAHDRGQPSWTQASDPASALKAFCNQPQLAGRFTPLYLAPSRPASVGEVMGVVQDPSSQEGPVAVRIRLDRRSGKWGIGNGRDPVPFEGASSFDAAKSILLTGSGSEQRGMTARDLNGSSGRP